MKIKLISAMLMLCISLCLLSLISCNGNEEKDTATETEELTETPPLELAEANDLAYVILGDEKYCVVLGLSSAVGAKRIVIPEKYDGIPVVAISSGAFSSSAATHLEAIELPETIKYIGENAFEGCTKLSQINIPQAIEYIGAMAFEGCDRLPLTEYQNALYIGNSSSPYTVLVRANDKKIESCTVHQDTKIIYEFAFANCTEMDNISIPDGIRHIGLGAFDDCHDLEYTTHESIRYIGNEKNPYLVCLQAIAKRNATSYIIHESAKIIAPLAFEDCEKLVSVTIPNELKVISAEAFIDCPSLDEFIFDRISEWTLINRKDFTDSKFILDEDQDFSGLLSETNQDNTWIRQ